MKIIELKNFSQIEDYGVSWDYLLNISRDNHIFLTREWLETWWKHFGANKELLLLAVEEGGKILAVAPLMKTKYKLLKIGLNVIEFIGSPHSDYHSFILVKEPFRCVSTIMNYINEQNWDCIELKNIPEDSETSKVLNSRLRDNIKLKQSVIDICVFVRLPKTLEEYLLMVPKKIQTNMFRREKKLKSTHKIEYKSFIDLNLSIEKAMEIFFTLHQKRWQSKGYKGVFANCHLRNFHMDVAKKFSERGWLNLFFLCSDGEPIAAEYAFQYKNKCYLYLTGFDPKYAKFGIGILSQFYAIQYSIRNGLKEFDMMRGYHPYKMQWGSRIRRNLELNAVRWKPVPKAYEWIVKRNVIPSLSNWLRNKALNSVW